MSRNLFIKTYGCQMNAYDSARMADALAVHGFTSVAEPAEADLIILNTCHIREKAAEKVYSELGRLRRLKDARTASGRELMIGIAGCVAQAEGGALLERAPFVDLVVGPQTYHRLPELVQRRLRADGGVIDTEFPLESKFDRLPEESAGATPVSAFLSVQEGCDKFCTFCVVPYTRGAEASRPAADVLAEARRLVRRGAREIVLLGQNVNAYHGEGPEGRTWSLARLIRGLAEIEALTRIRYTTSHPLDVSDDLIVAHAEVPKLMPYLHLPLQSGSDRVLKAMNRRHTLDDYRRIADRLRAARPDLALSSDFIVGFPGEDDSDFQATLRAVDAVGFAQAFSFKYSRRPGTPGALMGRQVAEPVKRARLAALQGRLAAQSAAFDRTTVGRRLPVLLERDGRYPGQKVGRSPYLQAVHLAAAELPLGALVMVEVTGAGGHSLTARALDPRGAGHVDEAVEAVA